jgi:uncharacterized protein
VTGASAGIGEQFARELAGRGTDLVLVARNSENLERLAGVLRSEHDVGVEVIAADLTDPGLLAEVEARLEHGSLPVDLLVNNAGSETEHAGFLERDRERLADEASLNALALLRLTHAAAGAMARRGGGNVLNVSGGVAFYPTPGAAAYAASKAFVNSLGEALDFELRRFGVRVTTVCPGFTPTGAQARLGLNVDWVPSPFVTSRERVVRTALRAAARGQTVCSPGTANAIVAFLGRHLPHRLWLPGVARMQLRLGG